ncbi:MAG: N-acetylmuramic acid 6-phosphate etherase [Pirellula sp.]
MRKSLANVEHLTTEQTNPNTIEIDSLSTMDIIKVINAEDEKVAAAVAAEAHAISQAVDIIAAKLSAGGRLLYIGAGTSGRLGVLDASECPPTFNTPPELVVGIIAGGSRALTSAIEGAEDNEQAAIDDLIQHQLSGRDVLVGIASSGRTPYVISGLRYAKSLGAASIGITCNRESDLRSVADIVIAPIVGPEVISGSTRLKAGTATKMVLNMLTTATMVILGKTYGNWMVDLRATNFKLKARSIRIVSSITGLTPDKAEQLIESCDGDVKTAIVVANRSISPKLARELLKQVSGRLRLALESTIPDWH